MKRILNAVGCSIKLGTMLHSLIELITLGNAYEVSYYIARKCGKESCGCLEREKYLNELLCGKCR